MESSWWPIKNKNMGRTNKSNCENLWNPVFECTHDKLKDCGEILKKKEKGGVSDISGNF